MSVVAPPWPAPGHVGPSAPRRDGLSAQWSYRPHLDGLRAVAVYLVVLFHAGTPGFEGGFIGVDVFFVISGFVVTGVLLAEYAEHGTLRFRRFYARRVRRLLPAAVVALVVVAAGLALSATPFEQTTRLPDVISAALYVSNWHFVAQATDYFGSDIVASPVLHFWSLSVEEQFYIAWPLLLLGLIRLGLPKGRLVGARTIHVRIVALALVSMIAMMVVARTDVMRAYYGTDLRAYQLLAGAALAVSANAGQIRARRVGGLGWIALGSLVLVGTGLWSVAPTTRGVAATLTTVLFIWAAEAQPSASPPRVLGGRIPVRLGEISYGTYLWHWPVAVALSRMDVMGSSWRWVPVSVVATIIAVVSYQGLEMPIRRGRWLAARNGIVLVGGVTASIAAAAAGAVLLTNTPEPEEVDWQAAQADRADHVNCIDAPADDCVLVDGGHPHVLLIGDSHGAHLIPALEEAATEHGFRLSVMTMAGCPWADVVTVRNGNPDGRCEAYRQELMDRVLPELGPDAVILANRIVFHREVETENGDVAAPGTPEHDAAIQEGMRISLEEFVGVAPDVVVVDQFPESEERIPECLSSASNPSACDFAPVRRVEAAGLLEQLVRKQPSATMVNLGKAVCPGTGKCPAVAPGTGTITRVDQHHLTSTFSRERSDATWRAVSRVLG